MENVLDLAVKSIVLVGVIYMLIFFFLRVFFPPIRWDKKEQQIMAGRRCLFDKRNMSGVVIDLAELKEEFKQYKCGAKGHGMKFKEKTCARYPYPSPLFVFRCCLCDYEEAKTEKDLSIEEKRALKKLGLL